MKFNWIKGKQSQKNIDSFPSRSFIIRFNSYFWERKAREISEVLRKQSETRTKSARGNDERKCSEKEPIKQTAVDIAHISEYLERSVTLRDDLSFLKQI